MKIPRRPNRSTEWGQCVNELIDYLEASRVQTTPTVKATHTTRGTFLEAAGKSKGVGSTDAVRYKRQWVPGSYNAGDEVILDSIPGEHDDGNLAARYFATDDVVPTDARPGVASPTAATGTVEIVDGEVVGITITDFGSGYASPPVVTISGDGTGATAEWDLGAFVTITNGGSGYTTATVEFAPPGPQKWEVSARSNFQKFTMRLPGTSRKIEINVGRDDGDPVYLTLFNDTDDEEVGCVKINLSDIAETVPTTGGARVIELRETDMCEDGAPKKALFLRGEAYDPPA